MDYKQTIDYLYNQLPMFQVLGPGAYKPGLDTAHAIDSAFDNPHAQFKTIHVAGTNGKGSTSHTLASILMAAGYKVGLYTSPHLFDFRERIRVNGEKISEQAVVDFTQRYLDMNLPCAPSFFELTTIMAFDYFASQGVDIAVIEVGLGGRLDTTNIITPILSIITNVSPDHVALLGDTLPQIASEKAGIIKEAVPVVIGEADEDTRPVYEAKAAEAGAPIVFAQDSPIDYEIANGHYRYSMVPGGPIVVESDLSGDCQPKNANTVMHALPILNGILPKRISEEAIIEGMANVQKSTHLMGRWMELSTSPTVICDTGHNIGAWQYLAPKLTKISEERPLRLVVGFANDKDVEAIFKLLPRRAEYFFVAPKVKRARPAQDLVALAQANGLHGQACESVADGYEKALTASNQGDMVFVGGSNFVVAELPISSEQQ